VQSSLDHPKRIWQVLGALLLLFGAFLDNLRGPLLPLISKDLGLNLADLGGFLAVGNLAAILGTFLLIPLMQHLSERRTAMGAAFLLTLGWLAIRLSQLGFGSTALSLYFGLSTSLCGALSNIFVVRGTPLKDQPRMLSGQQMMYGIGSMLAPLAVALVTSHQWPWSLLIVGMAPLALGLFLWIKFGLEEQGPAPEQGGQRLTFDSMKLRVFLTFMGYVASEVACSMWMATYLSAKFDLSVEQSSPVTSGFFAVMMMTRLLCFFFASAKYRNLLMWASLIIPAVVVTAVQLGGSFWLLPLAGCFGPFFPMYFSMVSRHYPDEWRSMSIWLIVSLQIALMAMNLGVGQLAEYLGSAKAYWFIPITLVFTLLLFYQLLKKLEPKTVQNA
jgi:MFS family permease